MLAHREGLAGVIAVVVALGWATSAGAATITTTTSADDITPNDGSVSLREAITALNAGNNLGDPDIIAQNPGTFGSGDNIRFNISGAGVHTINVGSDASAANSPLPQVTSAMTIDATTQSGAGAVRVALDGASAGASAVGLSAIATVTVKGLDIKNFSSDGILLTSGFLFGSSSGSTVQGNYIGTSPTGATAAPDSNGIVVVSSSDTIAGNVISGNLGGGVALSGNSNTVGGNMIGTNAAGTAAIPNGGVAGVAITGNNNALGGSASGSGNVISGNTGKGVTLSGNGNAVAGNFIGADASGTAGIPNLGDGVGVAGGGQTISGSPAAPQKIWFNGGAGIRDSAVGDRFSGNSIKGNAGGGIAVGGSPSTGTLSLAADRQTATVAFSNATPGQIEAIEVFDNVGAPGCPGQGEMFVGGALGTSSGAGTGAVTILLPQALAPGDGLTATIFDPPKGTSPFVCLPGGVPAIASAPTPTPTPNSNFSALGNPSVNTTTGAITFTESVSDPGTFSWVLTFQNGKFGVFTAAQPKKCKTPEIKLKGRCRRSRIIFGKASTTVAAPGSVHFTVKPSASAMKALNNALKQKQGLSVTATLTFQSSRGGNPVSHTQTITAKLKQTKKKGRK